MELTHEYGLMLIKCSSIGLYLMHDWYTSSTLVEVPTSRMIGTCFIEDLEYMYKIHHFLVLVHGGVHVLIHSYMAYA
jgi:hypothetical protein